MWIKLCFLEEKSEKTSWSYRTLQQKGDGYTRAAPTTAGSTLRRDMLSSRVVKDDKSSHSTGVGDIRLQRLAMGKAEQCVVGTERRGRSPPPIYKKRIGFLCNGSRAIGV